MIPFTYPDETHARRHGPEGYEQYESYRDWLRDEFRCVYYLKREVWGLIRGSYDIDHYVPQSIRPDLALTDDNLLYSCRTCNAAKGNEVLPNPCEHLLQEDVVIHEDGTIEGYTKNAQKIIRVLGLDSPEYCEFRRLWIDIIALAQTSPDLLTRILGFPDELPNLSTRRPPRNSRPDGVDGSCFARRARNELPPTY